MTLAKTVKDAPFDGPVFETWRDTMRALLQAEVTPENLHWSARSQQNLFDQCAMMEVDRLSEVHVPSSLVALLEDAALHCESARFSIMYRMLWRVTHGERHLLDDVTDEDVAALSRMQREVRRDAHKMTAFVRFNPVPDIVAAAPQWFAWYAPIHHVLRRVAPHFVRRFATMSWAIATPDAIAVWDRERLRYLPPIARPSRTSHDDAETLWLTYYRSIFNPARLNVRAMQKEMPQHYWANLPEARVITELVVTAPKRVARMINGEPESSESPPQHRSIALRENRPSTNREPSSSTPASCRRCPLWQRATQAVPGKGPEHAAVMLVGEQPGDEEDLRGEPFVGRAGNVLRRALAEIGADIAATFVTNAVKHFSWEPRGKRRIHKTPAQREIDACRSWLDDEIARVQPRVLVALGATAAYSLLHEKVAIATAREADNPRHASGTRVYVTYHPAAILRARDSQTQQTLYEAFVADLRRAYREARERPGVDDARNSSTAATSVAVGPGNSCGPRPQFLLGIRPPETADEPRN